MVLLPSQLENLLSEVQQGRRLGQAEVVQLLGLRQADAMEMLFEAARNLRRLNFGQKIFTYGFAYTSTFCRNNCRFCYFRRTNAQPQRYRKKPEDVLEVARHLAREGVHLIDVTMGEDPRLHDLENGTSEELIHLIAGIKEAVGLPIMVSPGVISDRLMKRLAAAGITWYACYQETHNPALFSKLRIGQDFEKRLQTKRLAKQLGVLIEEGILCGVGETLLDIAHSIEMMRALDADQVRVMKFVPQPGTPMAGNPEEDSRRECLIIAVLRLIFPDRLIPASLDVDGLAGLKMRLHAGANVVTSLVPPDHGLAGVAHADLDIENANRTVAGIRPILDSVHLTLASRDDYLNWLRRRR